MKRTFAQKFLSVFLSVVLFIEPSILLARQTNSGQPQTFVNVSSKKPIGSELNPFWDDFISAQTEKWEHRYELNEPSLDQDPFFLRAQRWIKTQPVQSNGERQHPLGTITYVRQNGGVTLYVGQSGAALNLQVPLLPIQATDEHIFFSLDKNSNLFQKASGDGAKPGEGIFFISQQELRQAAKSNYSIPVYYLPIAGNGWTGQLESLHIPQAEVLVVSNGKESIPFELKDVSTLMKAQQTNLMMATAFTIKNYGMKRGTVVYPLAGTTAAFGMVFTGLDLKNPENSLWSPRSSVTALHEFELSIQETIQNYPFLKTFAQISNYILPNAQAFEMSENAKNRIVYVGSGLILMLGVSFLIKYNHLGIRKKLEAKYPLDKEKPLKFFSTEFNRENRMLFDIFSAVTTTAAQIPSVTTAQATEMFLDRFAPAATASDHTIVRRILNNTIYYSRNQMRNVPVNHKTFVMGAIVLNGVDTGSLGIQYEVAVPWISQGLANYGDDEFKKLVATTFAVDNKDSARIIVEDTVRNGLAYALTGAASQSMEAKGIYEDGVTREIEAAMRKEGKNPLSVEHKKEKEKRIEERLDVILQQQGLPSRKDFLFDLNTVYGEIPRLLGYTSQAMERKGSYILARRYMLTGNALDKSIALAKEWARTDDSGVAQQALALLEETKSQLDIVTTVQKYGAKEGLAISRSARRQLTILSYQGPVDMIIRQMPKVWRKNYPPVAANVAGVFFRQALYSYISAEGDQTLFPSEDRLARFSETATKIALAEMQNKDAAIKSSENLSAAQKFEFKMRTQIAVNNLARAEAENKKADEFKGPEMDWLARRRHKNALAVAESQLDDFNQSEAAISLNSEQLFAKKMQFYRDALAASIGLHLEDIEKAKTQGREDFVRVMELAESQATARTESEIKNDLGMKTFLAKLNQIDQAKMKMYLYANNFFQAYKIATTEMEMVKPTDPAQPGRLQRFRQTETVRSSPVLTRILRVAESPFEDKNLSAGVMGTLARSFPLGADFVTTQIQTFKRFPILMTSSYLFNFYAWQMHLPYGAWLTMMAASALTISTPSAWLMRGSRMQGLKPKANALSQIAYGLPYTWVTFTGMIPMMLYSPTVQRVFNDFVRDPVVSIYSGVPMSIWIGSFVAAAVTWKLRRENVNQVVAGKSNSTDGPVRTSQLRDQFYRQLDQSIPRAPVACADLF